MGHASKGQAGDPGRAATSESRLRGRYPRLGLAVGLVVGAGGLAVLVVDRYVAEESRFGFVPLLVAGFGIVAGAWLAFGDQTGPLGVVVAAVIGAVAAVAGLLPEPDSPPADREQSTCPVLEEGASVESAGGPGEIQIEDVTYTVTRSKDPYIQISGRLTGDPDRSEGLYVVKTGNPATEDSTPERNPGTTGYFMSDEVDVGSGGCWGYARTRLGYPCVGGVEFRFYFALITDDVAEPLLARRRQVDDDGLPASEFLQSDAVDLVGYIDVPTEPHPTCRD